MLLIAALVNKIMHLSYNNYTYCWLGSACYPVTDIHLSFNVLLLQVMWQQHHSVCEWNKDFNGSFRKSGFNFSDILDSGATFMIKASGCYEYKEYLLVDIWTYLLIKCSAPPSLGHRVVSCAGLLSLYTDWEGRASQCWEKHICIQVYGEKWQHCRCDMDTF